MIEAESPRNTLWEIRKLIWTSCFVWSMRQLRNGSIITWENTHVKARRLFVYHLLFCICSIDKKKGIKIILFCHWYSSHRCDLFCNNYNKRLGAIWEGCFKRFGMTFAAFYRKMQFCYCPGVGHLHTFLKPHHDEFLYPKENPMSWSPPCYVYATGWTSARDKVELLTLLTT